MNDGPETPNSETPPIETPAEPSLINGQTTPTEPPTTDEKPVEEAAAVVEEAPLTAADIEFPEGFTPASDELTNKFVETINDKELSAKDRATALLNLQAETMKAAEEARSAEWTKLQDTWRDEVKNDPEIGGDKLQPTLDSINRLVAEHGNEKLVEALAYTGAGNNPEVVRFFSKMANLLTEGGYASGSPAGQEKTAAQRLFPSMPN